MKVKELIEKLQNLDPEKEVWYAYATLGGHYIAHKIYTMGEYRVGYHSKHNYLLVQDKGEGAYANPGTMAFRERTLLTRIRNRVCLM